MSKVWILVTLFNREQNLPGLFDRFEKQGFQNFKLVLIDHGSEPIRRSNFPLFVEYLRSSPDKWWTGAINDGLRYVVEICKASDDDYVIFQNDDVSFDEKFLSDLISASQSNRGAVIGALTLDEKTRLIMDADNHSSLLGAMLGRHICPFRGKPYESIGSELRPSDILKGRGVIYPLPVIRKIGYLYEKLNRRSDPEYAWRAKQHGFGVFVDPKIVVYSAVDPRTQFNTASISLGMVFEQLVSPRSYLNLRDAFYYYYKCFNFGRATVYFISHGIFAVSYCFYKYIQVKLKCILSS